MFSDAQYNVLKKLVQIIIPAASSLYFGLAQIWGLPAAEQIVGTCALVCTFLGILLGISTSKYNKSDASYDGTVVVTSTETGGKAFSLELNDETPIDNIEDMSALKFKVIQSQK